ncbi:MULTISPECIES: ABC transporter permease [Marinobacter]|jgi:peptide/nickel transport system permease protein|uniref:ABC transporter permease n=1 Tax=Marinobacter TaxID=2742 RepID=UPI0007D921BF|nr:MULTISPECIES: ABC transporter permease [Marinobacter]MBL3826638.1 ABC transporter permease [Marinobacter sp. MC3]MBL3895153.1 ABC transporter permease [Marinobacter sp. MW3]MCD1649345.1 ABC transporter permease [Marinobacter adhaerens]OAN93300.1 ABC transporter permease [Marinobacter sp. EhN04]OAN94309.1 ABC transporter permease [Marinobacter sp. EhC06]
MFNYILRRGLMALLVALTVSFGTFALFHFATDPAQTIAGEDAPQEMVDDIREQYGFDRPVSVQYGDWLGSALQGDFGQSYFWKQPVVELIKEHAKVTIVLALSALGVTILIALPLGISAALKPNSWVDRFALSTAVSAQAIPNFWLGLMLIILFSVTFPIFPVSGDATWKHYVLPALVLGASSVPAVMRLTRTGLLDVLSSDYIRTARAKGFVGYRLILQQAMRNALLPIVSVLAVQLGHKLGGSVVTESVFSMNGLGRLAVESIFNSDIPTVQSLILIFVLTFVLLTLAADLINAWLDPRIRMG